MSNAVTIALHEKQELTLESLSRSAFSPQRLVEHVLVLSSDERSQALALKTGLAATFTHDYKRHGTPPRCLHRSTWQTPRS